MGRRGRGVGLEETRGIDRLPVTAEVATSLAVSYRLRAADAAHLAAAVVAGAERFITNNRRVFQPNISEIKIVYPDQLAV